MGIQWEQKLLDVPCAVQCFFHEVATPPIPTLAVASGHQVFIYRYMRPYLKFTLPPIEIDQLESEVWEEMHAGSTDISTGCEKLNAARENGTALSNYSIDLLAMEDPEEQLENVKRSKESLLQQNTAITCMEVLKQNMDEPTAVSMLVLGTENRMVYILDSSALNIATKVELAAVPAFISVLGLYHVEGKNKKNHSIYLPCPISCMNLLQLTKARAAKALVVALNNGEVRLYNGKHLISTTQTNDLVTGMKLGTFGREEGSMVLSFKSGALMVKILQRNANLEVSSATPGPPVEQDIPLDVPKKTKLYVEQTSRERDQAIDVHRTFQRDLCKLRLSTARGYVNLLGTGHGPMSSMGGAQVRLNAQVVGMGPQFKVVVRVQNAGAHALYDVPLMCTSNPTLYRLSKPCSYFPNLVPQQSYIAEIPITCINENGGTDCVRVFLCS